MSRFAEYAIGEVEPAMVSTPESVEALAEDIRQARSEKLSVLPRGEGSRLGAGGALERLDGVLVTTRLSRIVQYEPDDLTVTVEAGCRLADLDQVLGERGQFLPLQHLRASGTVGGLLATGAEGAPALGYGSARDRLTGVRVVLADGSIVRSGGRVVKNVAGYGIHRLMLGSFGTLGVIVEASFKVQPRPEAEATAIVAFDSIAEAFEGAQHLIDSGTEPVLADVVIVRNACRIVAGFDGTAARVKEHLSRLETVLAPAHPAGIELAEAEGSRALRAILENLGGEGADSLSRFGSSLAPEARGHEPEPGAIEGGAAPPRATDAMAGDRVVCIVRITALPSRLQESLTRARRAAREAGALVSIDARPALGSALVHLELETTDAARRSLEAALAAARPIGPAIVLSAPAEVRRRVDPWGPPPTDFFLMKRIKQALDPDGVFAAGRFVGGL